MIDNVEIGNLSENEIHENQKERRISELPIDVRNPAEDQDEDIMSLYRILNNNN